MAVRLHKYLASCGIGSRRQCERWMAEGRVSVDGVVASAPGTTIEPDRCEVVFAGRPVRPEVPVYLALNKPPGYVCTSRDPQGRPRAIELAPRDRGRLYTIGRLDAESEGLILLTNDGAFAHRLMHPRHEVVKTYELWLDAPLDEPERQRWRSGIQDGGESLRVLSMRPLAPGKSGHGYKVQLGEGKNRHLRRMARQSGRKVLRLKRVAIGMLQLGSLKRGSWRWLTPEERQVLSGNPERRKERTPVPAPRRR